MEKQRTNEVLHALSDYDHKERMLNLRKNGNTMNEKINYDLSKLFYGKDQIGVKGGR